MDARAIKGHSAMLGANVLWGLMAPVSKLAMASGLVSSLLLTNFRMVGAAVAFWILSIFVKREPVTPGDMVKLFFASMLGIVLNQFSFIMGLNLTSPIDASIVTTTTPILVMILAAILLKEPITGLKVGGIFAGAMGALTLIISSTTASSDAGHGGNIWGDFLCLFAQICYSLYFVLFKDLIGRYSAVTLMKWMFTYATIVIVPLPYRELVSAQWDAFTSQEIAGSLYVVLGGTFLSYLLIPIGQHVLRPTVAVMYNYAQPIVASAVAVTMGMDTFGLLKILAIALVFGGVYMVTQSKSRAQLETEKIS